MSDLFLCAMSPVRPSRRRAFLCFSIMDLRQNRVRSAWCVVDERTRLERKRKAFKNTQATSTLWDGDSKYGLQSIPYRDVARISLAGTGLRNPRTPLCRVARVLRRAVFWGGYIRPCGYLLGADDTFLEGE